MSERKYLEEDHRPWTSYYVIEDIEGLKVKRIVVKPDKRLSLQHHLNRDEHWYIISGVGQVTLGKFVIPVTTGFSIDIPKETIHRIHNTGSKPLTFVEISTGNYLGEDDLIHHEDDFGRIEK